MNELMISEEINIENMIYEIRGKQVMLDSDLAKLYKTETYRINEAVKNNPLKFPERYCFRITETEYNDLISKKTISNRGGARKGHNVFTEQGVAMLATILKSKVAIEVSIKIMDAFVAMKKYISTNIIEQHYINNMVLKNDERLTLVENTLNKLSEKQKVNTLFYDGQIYDAYSLLMEILDKAKEEIIIIDDYAGKELLNILKDIDKKIIIVSSNINDTLIKKYKSQYNNVEFIKSDLFHDRFIIIDRKVLYNCGSSFKDLGKKCFGIHLMEDEEHLDIILNKIEGENV